MFWGFLVVFLSWESVPELNAYKAVKVSAHCADEGFQRRFFFVPVKVWLTQGLLEVQLTSDSSAVAFP